MLSSLAGLLTAVAGAAATVLAGLWARDRYRALKADRDRIQATHDAIDAAGQRLEAARKAEIHPIDTKRRADFERQP